jgi:hypothetical protein
VKAIKAGTLLFFLFFVSFSYAAVTPGPASLKTDLRKIKVKDVEKLTGKKLSFFQKIKLKIILAAANKLKDGELTEKQERQATASMALGIGSLALMFLSMIPFISFIGILCIPAAILAIIFGARSLKGNSNSKGIVGVVTGGVTLLIIAVAIILLAILFAGFGIE